MNHVPGSARLHWILGPVGAGKSTLALELASKHRAVRMNLDQWMATLFRTDRPEHGVLDWYRERTERCLEQIWSTTLQIAEAGTSVILELGLIERAARAPFWELLDASGFEHTIYVLDAPRAVRRARVEQRNNERGATFAMVVPMEIFELASDLWEPLDERECAGRDVRYIAPPTQ
jgi:predicted kinase